MTNSFFVWKLLIIDVTRGCPEVAVLIATPKIRDGKKIAKLKKISESFILLFKVPDEWKFSLEALKRRRHE